MCHNTFSLLPIWLLLHPHSPQMSQGYKLFPGTRCWHAIFHFLSGIHLGVHWCCSLPLSGSRSAPDRYFLQNGWIAHIYFSLFLPKAATASGFPKRRFLSDRHKACHSHIGRTTGLPGLPVCLPLQKPRLLLPPLKEENISPTDQEPVGVHSACLSDPASRVPVFFFDSSRNFWCVLSSDASRLQNI